MRTKSGTKTEAINKVRFKTGKRKYSRIGSILWALRKLWRLDPHFIFFIFFAVPFAIVFPLATSYFSKVLLDALGRGASFAELAGIVLCFTVGLVLLDILRAFMNTRCTARNYYPTCVYITEMMALLYAGMDYENTEKQDFQKIAHYAIRNAGSGDCSLEFVWRDLSGFLVALVGIGTYGSLLGALDPLLFTVVLLVSFLSYFATRWQPRYYEKHKHEFEKESRKLGYLKGLSGDFAVSKDIKLYGMEPWLDVMVEDYQGYLRMWEKNAV